MHQQFPSASPAADHSQPVSLNAFGGSWPGLDLHRGLVQSFRPTELLVKNSKIMIVDDEPIVVKTLRKHLGNAGYQSFVLNTTSIEAIKTIMYELPDVVILDVMMPQVSGLEILEAMRADVTLAHIPAVMMTASRDVQLRDSAWRLGATDFLSKPIDPNELQARIGNILIVKAHHEHLAHYSARLEHEVRTRTAELEESRKELIRVLGCAAEYRDKETANHVLRVGAYAGLIAQELGLDEKHVELIRQASQLHDVGKIGIADAVLLKPGRLTPEEMDVVRRHCEYGVKILLGKPCNTPMRIDSLSDVHRMTDSPILKMAAMIAWTHHEKWDGTGYPSGLSGEDIPLEGRITAVVDVFDALSSKRRYKSPLSWEACFDVLEQGRSEHFDARVVDAFFARGQDILRVRREFADG